MEEINHYHDAIAVGTHQLRKCVIVLWEVKVRLQGNRRATCPFHDVASKPG